MSGKKSYKVVSLLLLLTLVFALMAGCGKAGTSEENTTAPGTSAVTTTAAGTEPASDELEYIAAAKTPVDMKMFFNATWFDAANWGKDIVSKVMMEKTGVNLTIETPAADDNQKLNLMLASGDKLPDIINVDRMNDALFKMIQEKKIYSYDELAQKYAPNMLKLPFVVNNREVWAQQAGTAADGQLYFFSGTCIDAGKVSEGKQFLGAGSGWTIRQDIYEELGSPELKTPDDLYNILKQVKVKYPNITHPLLPYLPIEGVGYEAHSLFSIYFSFGGSGFQWNDGSGQLEIHDRDPRYLQALLWVNKLYREGLINISDFTDKQDQQDATVRQDKVFAFAGPVSTANDANKELAKANPKAKYVPIDPLLAPGVEKYSTPASYGLGWMCPVITKDCENPDRAIKFIEYCCTDEQQAMAYAGREGIDWQWGGADGKSITLIGEAKADYDASYDDWKKKYGTSKEYSFVGNQYYRDCLKWGFAEGDSVALKSAQLQGAADPQGLQYSFCFPDNGSEEMQIASKATDLLKQYVAKVCTAKSEADAIAAYNDAMKKLDAMSYSKVEAVWTAKWQKWKPIMDNLLNK